MAFAPKRKPVFCIRKWRGGPGYFRAIQTVAEHRLNQHIDDDEPKVRAARGSRILPDAWDDPVRCHTRSWKMHRKTRWKVV